VCRPLLCENCCGAGAWQVAAQRSLSLQPGSGWLLRNIYTLDPAARVDALDNWDQRVWANAEHQQLYATLAYNVVRMALLLHVDETDRQCASGRFTKPVLLGDPGLEVNLRGQWLPNAAAVQPGYAAADRALVDHAMLKLEQARNGCVAPLVGDGTGAAIQFYSNSSRAQAVEGGKVPVGGYALYTFSCDDVGRNPASITWDANGIYYFPTAELRGRITARYTGLHAFGLGNYSGGDRPTEIWIDGRQVLGTGIPGERNAVQLAAGQTVSYLARSAASVKCDAAGQWQFTWRVNSGPEQFIPVSAMKP